MEETLISENKVRRSSRNLKLRKASKMTQQKNEKPYYSLNMRLNLALFVSPLRKRP